MHNPKRGMLLQPIYLGLATDIIFYSVLWYILLCVPSYIRECTRNVTCKCAKCGYNLKYNITGVCSECGNIISIPKGVRYYFILRRFIKWPAMLLCIIIAIWTPLTYWYGISLCSPQLPNYISPKQLLLRMHNGQLRIWWSNILAFEDKASIKFITTTNGCKWDFSYMHQEHYFIITIPLWFIFIILVSITLFLWIQRKSKSNIHLMIFPQVKQTH